MLYKFYRASSDPYDRKIPIFNHIYVPILPESAQIRKITWYGNSYILDISCDQARDVNYDPYVTQAEYQKTISHYKDFAANNKTITSTSFDSERSATVYNYIWPSGSEHRLVYYSVTSNGAEYHIAENYSSPEATVPESTNVYCTDNGRYFSIFLYDQAVRPSVEWLTSFGIVEEPHLQLTTP